MYANTPSSTALDIRSTTVPLSHDISALTPQKKPCCTACANGRSGSGVGGLGSLFDSGLDVTQWGFGEYAVVGLGIYMAFKIWSDARRVGSGIQGFTRKRSVKRKKRKQLLTELRGL